MATATKATTTKLVPQPPKEVTEATYTLVLNQLEADTLRTVCASIGGHRNLTRRVHTDAIADSLCDAGICYVEGTDKSGYIQFNQSI